MNNPPEIRYRYCPLCGRNLVRHSASLYVCTGCRYHFYQNSKPSAGALILGEGEHGGREILLVRRGVDPFKGCWDIPGGFINNGEEPVEALKREIREELGVSVHVETLFTAEADFYPCLGVPAEASNTLCLYYLCSFLEPAPLLVPEDDIDEYRWFPIDRLPSDIAFDANRRAITKLAISLQVSCFRGI